MLETSAASVALVVATALHAGFQMVVTLLVYPAFADVPVDHWRRYHRDHTRRITGIVGVVYALLAAATGWVAVAGPRNAGTLAAIGLAAVAVLTTAVVAAPAHRRLSAERGEADLLRLLRADRVRFVAALVAAAAAVAGLWL